MAEAVAKAIEQQQCLLVEAGTGTGKTFGYLVPLLKSGKKVVISTGSKALQEQLFLRDLPAITKALEISEPTALLKGRSNYLCLERLGRFAMQGEFQTREQAAEITRVKRWSQHSKDGDVSGIPELRENSDILPFITSTNDNCLGRECSHYESCYLVKARRKAMEAQLVVINHHLFFADISVKDTGFGELLPDAGVYLFDEAHQLPEIATQYFGKALSSRQVFELCKEITIAYRTEAQDSKQLGKAATHLENATRDMRLAFGRDNNRGEWFELLASGSLQGPITRWHDAFNLCYELLKLQLGRGEVLDRCFERVVEFRTLLDQLDGQRQPGYCCWYESHGQNFSLNITPLSIAERFSQEIEKENVSWIFTSATLTVDERFDLFTREMGIETYQQLILGSPFDYQNQSLMLLPRYLPPANQYGRGKLLVKQMLPLFETVRGGIFFLCTSHQLMQEVAGVLRDTCSRNVLLQGEESKQRLLKQFTEDGKAILVATASFWEGVDVQGEALSCVVIDKLPFSSPDDPLMKARVDDCRMAGGDPFAELQLPKAVIALKQGAGRLIRDGSDTGVLVLCDPRLVSRNYGQLFLKSLPPMPRTRERSKAQDFFHSLDKATREFEHE